MNKLEVQVLKEYARSIFHMRRQLHRNRFCLVFGAGVSKAWDVPNWQELNEKIAEDPDVSGEGFLDIVCSNTIMTQRLFEHYKARRYSDEQVSEHHTVLLDRQIRKEWRDIIHRQLYAQSPAEEDIAEIEAQHPYISAYVKIMRLIPLTVNYNFDDFIERILAHHRDTDEVGRTRGFEVAWDMRFPFRSDKRVIYHPNGYLPHNIMEASEGIVLSEDEYAEQLFGALTGQYASLIHHLSRNTCLLIGLSLEDATLKHILRQVARTNPGQYHYYVHHYKLGKEPTDSEKKAVVSANFNTYNLVTLFLCDEKIAALGWLIGHECEIQDSAKRDLKITRIANNHNVETRYYYYIVGAVGAGKSTAVLHFRNLVAYDEWFEPRSIKLGKDPDTLSPEEVEELDKYVIDQFAQKNHELSEETPGVFIIDRCPLDPVSFTPPKQWPQKADRLLDKIAPGEEQNVVDGRVVLLTNDPEVLELRLIMSEKEYRKERLDQMQEDLKIIYNMQGVDIIDTRKMTLHEIIKNIARIIHLEKYPPTANIQKRLIDIKDKKVTRRVKLREALHA